MSTLTSGIGVYAGLGAGLAAGATVIGIGAKHAIDESGDLDDTTASRIGASAITAVTLPVAGSLGFMAALAPIGAFNGVYGDAFGAARGPIGGRALAFVTTGLAVAAGAGAVIAGAKALGLD